MAAVMSPPASNTTSTTSLSSHSSSPHSALSQLPPITTAATAAAATATTPTTATNRRAKSSSTRRQSSSSNSAPAPASSKRTSQYAKDRMSSISTASRTSRTNSVQQNRGETSRTHSTVFPLFHSSLPYSLVRDFGYPITDPLHYGPLPEPSGLATPSSEFNRRLSDPAPAYGDARSTGGFGGFGGWTPTDDYSQLPSRSFADEGESSGEWPRFADHGPPYSEDEDLQSPVLSSHGSHRRQQSNMVGMDRTRGRAGSRGMVTGTHAFESPPGHRRRKKKGRKRDVAESDRRQSKGTLPSRSFHEGETYSSGGEAEEDDDTSEDESTPVAADSPHNITASAHGSHASAPYPAEDEEHRHSMTYTFSIASPDEECHGKAVSLYNFERENDNELPLTEGQIILVSYRLSQGWLVAQDPRTGESGLVPESYVRLFRDLEGWEPDEEEEDDATQNPDAATAASPTHAKLGADATVPPTTAEQHIPGDGVPLPPDALTAPPHQQQAVTADGHDARQQLGLQVTASPEPTDAMPVPPDTAAKPSASAGATPHKPAVTSTFSTSRDDLEPRVDLLKQEGRRGSLDKVSRTGSKGRGAR